MAKDHLARLVLNLVREDIDLAAISGSYAGERGQPPFDPADDGAAALFVLLRHLVLAPYCQGVSRAR